MRKHITIAFFVAIGMLLQLHFQQKKDREAAEAADSAQQRFAAEAELEQVELDDAQGSRFPESADKHHCDGRKRFTQMHSCEEATWFIENCPGMEMDGDHDGVPCEDQYCRY